MNRDELSDDVDYYPDEYLNKLAHESINGLWLTVEFKDLCLLHLMPNYMHHSIPAFQKNKPPAVLASMPGPPMTRAKYFFIRHFLSLRPLMVYSTALFLFSSQISFISAKTFVLSNGLYK